MKTFAMRLAGRPALTCAALLLCGLTSSLASGQTPTEPPKDWTGSAGLGVSVTSGNSDTVNVNVGFDVTRTPKARNVMKWTGLFLRGSQNSTTVVNRTSLAYRDEYTISGRTYAFGGVDYLRDTFKRIDYLVAPTAGLGFNVLNTDARKFTVFGGAGTISVKDTGVDVRTSAVVTAGEKLALQLTPTAAIKHAETALWKANDFGDALYTSSIGLASKLSDRMQLTIDLLDTFKTRPPTAATKKNDVAFVTAIVAKF